MSSIAIPLTTREPRNGGANTGLSVSTSGERDGIVDASTTFFSLDGSTRPVSSRPNDGSSVPVRLSSMSRSIVRRPSKASLP